MGLTERLRLNGQIHLDKQLTTQLKLNLTKNYDGPINDYWIINDESSVMIGMRIINVLLSSQISLILSVEQRTDLET